MTNKRVPQRACRWLAALRSCIQAPRTEAENTAGGGEKKQNKNARKSGIQRLETSQGSRSQEAEALVKQRIRN